MPLTLRRTLAEAAARKVPDMKDMQSRMTRRACEKVGVEM